MKKNLSLLISIMLIFSQQIMAQLPDASTAENPRWYYVQVKGEGSDRIGRVFKLIGDDVFGRYLSDITDNADRDNFLFRFEKSGDSYVIVNKATNKRLGIRTDASKGSIEVLTVAGTSDITWKLNSYNGLHQIASSTGKYIHQANNYNDTRNYVMMLESSTWATSDNSLFSFELYDPTSPEVSDTQEIWYTIYSGNPAYKNRCITDVNETGSGIVKFDVQEEGEDNPFQQWKLIRPVNATDENVHFVNRATGNIIQTSYDYNGYYNVRSTDDIGSSNGWALTFINRDQFYIAGFDENGVKGYLNVSSDQKAAPEIPAGDNFFNSSFAWVFKKVDGGASIDEITNSDPFAGIRIYTDGKRIIVEGTDDYHLTHISGIRVPKEQELPTGVYLVTVRNKSRSVLVK